MSRSSPLTGKRIVGLLNPNPGLTSGESSRACFACPTSSEPTPSTDLRPGICGGTLKKAGFQIERQRGSHIFMKHPDGRATVVPVHAGETIGPGLFHKILRDVEIDREDFLKL